MEKYAFKNIVVLSNNELSDEVIHALKKVDPNKLYLAIHSNAQLMLLSPDFLKSARLIAIFTKIIVPKRVLDEIGYGAYNFHPGPSQFPGWAPFSFALFEGVKTYGVTAHEMIEEVDSGAIIAVEEFAIPDDMVQSDLEAMCVLNCLSLIQSLAKTLCHAETIPSLGIEWAKQRTYQKDFVEITLLTQTISRNDFHRKLRAFGSGDGKYLLRFQENDHVYQLDLHVPQDQITDYRELHGVKFQRVQ